MKRYIKLMIALTLATPASYGMTEDEQLQFALSESDPALAEAMLRSEETARDEQARILPAGVYPRVIDGYAVQQLALADEDKQSGENITCGPKVLFIAQALTTIVKTKQPITPVTMNAELKKLHYGTKTTQEKCKRKQLETGNIESYIQKNKFSLPSFFAIGAEGNRKEGLKIVPLETNVNPKQDLSPEDIANIVTTEDLSNQLKKTIAPYLGKAKLNPVHFFCDDARAGHWFLIAVVKNNNEFNLWYIDPKNVDLNLYPYAHTFIPYIYEYLVDPALTINKTRQAATPSSSVQWISKPIDPNIEKK